MRLCLFYGCFALTILFETGQAGIGIMFGDDKGAPGVIVKQLVPRGSAERNGKVHVRTMI